MNAPAIDDPWSVAQRVWPQLLQAAEPERYARTGQPVEVEELPRELLELDGSTWRERALQSPAGLVGPIMLRGGCLEPIFRERLMCWFDPNLPARDRDFCLVVLDRAFIEATIARQAPEQLKQFSGRRVETLVMKQLRHDRGWPYLVATDGALDRSIPTKIVGVLRYVERVTRREASGRASAARRTSRRLMGCHA